VLGARSEHPQAWLRRSKGEIFTGGGALAAPLKDFSGKTVAVMDILTPENRYTPHTEKLHRTVLDGARRGSERLGYRPEVGGQATHARLRIFVRCCA